MADISVEYCIEDASSARLISAWIARAGHRAVPVQLGAAANHPAAGPDCRVILWSAARTARSSLMKDVGDALKAWTEERLVLVRLDNHSLPPGLRDLETLSLRSGASKEARDRLIKAIRKLLRRQNAATGAASRKGAFAGKPEARSWPSWQSVLKSLSSTTFLQIGGALAAGLLTVFLAYWWLTGDPATHEPATRSQTTHQEHGRSNSQGEGRDANRLDGNTGRAEQERAGQGSRKPYRYSDRNYSGSEKTVSAEPPRSSLLNYILPLLGGLLVLGLIGLAVYLMLADPPWEKIVLTRRGFSRSRRKAASKLLFVSYSRRDANKVFSLASLLEKLGLSAWLDVQQGPATGRYGSKIVSAIKESRCIVVVGSRNAFSSDHVVREVYVGGSLNKPFVLLRLDRHNIPDDFLYFLSGYEAIDVFNLSSQQLRKRLVPIFASLGLLRAKRGQASPALLQSLEGNAQFSLSKKHMLVGRDPACDIRLSDPTVHRRHAMLHREADGGYVVVDLKDLSGNGVFINDERVVKYRLNPGDTIRFGHTSLRFTKK